ncbi:ankyrin repeat domain-containing protein [Nioella aestuarii]|uniref:ankyrin repeat domain-containing protein n=1 Tax=Nioella aestuarii TaxID=1662864 RepID=UPI003D7F1B4B
MKTLDQLRRDAKALRKAHKANDALALQRLKVHPPRSDGTELKHADYLHVIARESGFVSWPALKEAQEMQGLDRATKLQKLKIALAHGQNARVDRLLADTPDLADGVFGLQVALLHREAVEQMLAEDPGRATRVVAHQSPLCFLAFSKRLKAEPEKEADMLAIAEMLLAHGADVNDGRPVSPDSEHRLSVLYGAIGHADNMVLGRWLLDHGADPNDGESLYHATELGHHEGLRMLLEAGANPTGTNALLRAMDFDDHHAVRMLLDHGARADDFDDNHVGGEAPWVVPALHQAARRMCDAEMIDLLLEAGADPSRKFEGCTAYGYARVFGNSDLARAIEARGVVPDLTGEERLLAMAADGEVPPGVFIDPANLPEAYRNIIRQILHLPGKLEHVKRLVAMGVEFDRPDGEGLTPVQVAGWVGLPDVMGYLLSLKPDLTHVNGYGGTLLSTILHGADNCPERAERDYVSCLRLVLEHGVALPRAAIAFANDDSIAEFLAGWAEDHPGSVVEQGAF